jgi:predicted ester cyclase
MGELKRVTDDVWALFEAGKFGELSERIDADCYFKMPGAECRGREAIMGVFQAYRTGFPDLKHRVIDSVEAGDTIAVELVIEATHTGPMYTPNGVVPATGKRVTWESCDYVKVRNGKVVAWHVYHDPASFYAALGIGK